MSAIAATQEATCRCLERLLELFNSDLDNEDVHLAAEYAILSLLTELGASEVAEAYKKLKKDTPFFYS